MGTEGFPTPTAPDPAYRKELAKKLKTIEDHGERAAAAKIFQKTEAYKAAEKGHVERNQRNSVEAELKAKFGPHVESATNIPDNAELIASIQRWAAGVAESEYSQETMQYQDERGSGYIKSDKENSAAEDLAGVLRTLGYSDVKIEHMTCRFRKGNEESSFIKLRPDILSS